MDVEEEDLEDDSDCDSIWDMNNKQNYAMGSVQQTESETPDSSQEIQKSEIL